MIRILVHYSRPSTYKAFAHDHIVRNNQLLCSCKIFLCGGHEEKEQKMTITKWNWSVDCSTLARPSVSSKKAWHCAVAFQGCYFVLCSRPWAAAWCQCTQSGTRTPCCTEIELNVRNPLINHISVTSSVNSWRRRVRKSRIAYNSCGSHMREGNEMIRLNRYSAATSRARVMRWVQATRKKLAKFLW